MFNKFLLISGFFLVFISSPHIASGFKRKATIGWSLAKAACAQVVAYGETKTIQSRLKSKSAFKPKGAESCSKLMRTNCESSSCKRFECKLGGSGRGAHGKHGRVAEPEPESIRGIAPKGRESTVQVNGSYEYQLLFDVDNSRNLGEIWYATEYQKIIRTNTEILKHQAAEVAAQIQIGFTLDASLLTVASVHVEADVSFTFEAELNSAITEKTEKNVTIISASNYSIKGNSSLKLYQLCFNGPGLDERTDTVTSYPLAEHDDPVPFTVTYYLERFLKDIKAEYRDFSSTIPDDAIESFDRQQPTDLNAHANGTTKIYLVPEWTDKVQERVTYILSVDYNKPNTKYSNLDEGTAGPPRYLKMIRDVREPHGIVNLKIWRTEDPKSRPSEKGYEFWSSDLNAGKGIKHYQYLCWKTKAVPVRI